MSKTINYFPDRVMAHNESGFHCIAGDRQPVPVALQEVHKGLCTVAESATALAMHVSENPSAESLGTLAEAGRTVCKNFDGLLDAVSDVAKSDDKLKATTEELIKANDWISGEFSREGNVVNTVIPVVSSFNALLVR